MPTGEGNGAPKGHRPRDHAAPSSRPGPTPGNDALHPGADAFRRTPMPRPASTVCSRKLAPTPDEPRTRTSNFRAESFAANLVALIGLVRARQEGIRWPVRGP